MATTAHRRKRPNERWHDVGAAAELARTPLQQIQVHGTRMALSCVDGVFGAIHGTCNHAGGPLGQGTLEGDFVVCPVAPVALPPGRGPRRARLRAGRGAGLSRARARAAACR